MSITKTDLKTPEASVQKPMAWMMPKKDCSRLVKIDRISMIAFASSYVTLAAVSFALSIAVSPLLLIPAAFATAGAVGSIFLYRSIIDYDDPREVQQLRKEMENMPLSKILAKHRLINVCKVLSKGEFYDKFVRFEETASFQSAFRDYEDVRGALEKLGEKDFPIPEQWKEKLKRETAPFSLTRILQSYNLKKLCEHNLIDSSYRNKYLEETSNLDCLAILHRYPEVDLLHKQGLITEEEYAILATLRAVETQFKAEMAQNQKGLEKEIARLEKERNGKILRAEQCFHVLLERKDRLRREEEQELRSLFPYSFSYGENQRLIKQRYDELFRALSQEQRTVNSTIQETTRSATAYCQDAIATARKEFSDRRISCEMMRERELSNLNQQYRELSLQTADAEMLA